MRVIIVGAGEVGSNIAQSLADSHEVVVVDLDGDRVESLTYSLDVLAVEGDGASPETLEETGITDADLLIASTDDDETNIITCGTAKTVGDPFTIARVRNRKFLNTWQRAEGALGVDFMVGTTTLTAQSIVRVIGLPAARDVDTFAGGTVQMAEFEIPEGSPIAGQTVQEADRFDSLTFAAILRPDDLVIPTGQTVIQPGDEVVVIGSSDSVRQLSAEVAPHGAGGTSDVLLVGGSDISFQTARLLGQQGLTPRLVERDHDRARELAEALPNTTVLEHDATDREFLEREHVADVDVVVAALDNDEKNLLAGLLAKRLGADRAVAVVEDGEYVRLFEEVGIDVAVNPREVTAEEITRFTRERRAENVALIESDRAEVIELEVGADSTLAGRPISESATDLPEGVVLGAITRNGDFVVPRGDTVVEVGDHVVVFVDADHVEEATTQL
ncbi:Trk system potassium transporter TrkA [Halobacteriales archaeon Cl-PHB]